MTAEAEYRRSLGAYLLGALEPDEEARLVEHLRSCTDCHAELLDLGGVVADLEVLAVAAGESPGWLSVVPPPRLAPAGAAGAADSGPAGDSGGAGVQGRHGRQGRRNTRGAHGARGTHSTRGTHCNPTEVEVPRRRLFALAAAAACLATAGGFGFTMAQTTGEPAPAAASLPSGARTAEGRSTTPTVTGHAVLTPAVWGTVVQLTVAGTQQTVAAGVHCMLLAESRTGTTETISSWAVPVRSPTPEGERIRASTAIPIEELAKLRVVTMDERELLVVSV